MPILKRLRTLAAAIETTPGTAETLDASDGAFNAYEIIAQADIPIEEREAQGSMDYLSGVTGGYTGTLSFKTDMGWDGTTTMPSWASVLLPACGVVETSQVYEPTSEAPGSNVKTATIACYLGPDGANNGPLKQLAGAVGNFRIVMPTGRMVTIEWEFQGVWQAVTDAALIAPTYPTAAPIRFASATLQYDSVDLCVENVTFDAGNEIKLLECPDTAAGYKHGVVTDRKPRITANPESTRIAANDPYGDWLAMSEADFAVTLDGPSTSTIVLNAPKAQIINVQEGDRDKVVIDEVEWACNKNGATKDECFDLTFSETA